VMLLWTMVVICDGIVIMESDGFEEIRRNIKLEKYEIVHSHVTLIAIKNKQFDVHRILKNCL
jgi:hypothetical protein